MLSGIRGLALTRPLGILAPIARACTPALFSTHALPRMERPAHARFSWSAEKVREVIPFTSEFAGDSRGVAVSYCPAEPAKIGPDGIGEKPPSASWLEIVFPFTSNPALRNAFVKWDERSVRYGKLFEQLDAFAADCAYRHAEGMSLAHPLTIVTAGVDGLRCFDEITVLNDMKLQAYVTWTGRSSMEIRIDIISIRDTAEVVVGHTSFIFVARMNDKAAPVHRLLCTTEAEKERFAFGALRNDERKEMARTTLDSQPPLPEEVQVMHQLYLNNKFRRLPATLTRKNMSDTCNRATLFMHPQERNIHGKMFGGFLMRQAFELAWITAICFHGDDYPIFTAVDDIHFLKPVSCGMILEFASRVVYTKNSNVRIRVDAFHIDNKTGQRDHTNVFHYHFRHPGARKLPVDTTDPAVASPMVNPQGYEEYVLYLEGRRKHDEYVRISKEEDPSVMERTSS